MFEKILIANRGEVALRIIRTCKELGIKTVAIYSETDRNSLHVRFADEAVCIGPAPASQSYLNIPRIIAAAEITNADAVHPGYGFLAENAEFAEICNDSNVVFIGPSPEMIRKMGDKAMAKDLMRKGGVPLIPGSEGKLNDIETAREICKSTGYPIMLKASAGGGGKGMRIVRNETELEQLFNIAKSEALSAFGDSSMYIEKLIESPRHIEIQVIGDKYGNITHAGERDCTIQRRHQKLIEETPSPVLTNEIRENIARAAVDAAKTVDYESLGTVEFLVDKDLNFYFMEMNTRVQVEHPITEEVTKSDLIREQIRIAAGEKLSRRRYKSTGHSIECRINAEDTEKKFAPSPGLITAFHTPGGGGVRIDTHCYAGYSIPPNYDSMIGKLIVYAASRDEAVKKMQRALDEFIIEGVKTTIPLFKKILADKMFINNDYDTNYLDKRENEK